MTFQQFFEAVKKVTVEMQMRNPEEPLDEDDKDWWYARYKLQKQQGKLPKGDPTFEELCEFVKRCDYEYEMYCQKRYNYTIDDYHTYEENLEYHKNKKPPPIALELDEALKEFRKSGAKLDSRKESSLIPS